MSLPPRVLFDPTTYELFKRCEQEFVERDVYGIRVPGKGPALVFGEAVHAGLRALYDEQDEAACIEAVRKEWGTNPPVFLSPRSKKGHDHRTLEYAEQIVRMYPGVYDPAASPFTVVENERYIEDPPNQECGVVDRVVRAKSDGLLYVMDTKTTSLFPGDAYAGQWAHNVQLATYMDLAETVLDETVAGVWLDVVYVSTRGYVKTGSDGDFHRYGPYSYSPELRHELRMHRAKWRARMKDLQDDPARALKSPHSCMRYNKLCLFFEHCCLDPGLRADNRAMKLGSGEWTEERWDPSTKDG